MTIRAPRADLQEHRIEDLAADVIEVDIDPLGTMLPQRLLDVFGLVVDGGVEAQIVDDVLALLGSAGDADRVAPLDLGDLTGDHADGTGRPGDDHGFAGFRLTDVEQAEIGRHSGRAEDTQPDRQAARRWCRSW